MALNQKGSTLVLVLVAVLILSLIGISSLTQSGTEVATSRNFQADKTALFTADAGINFGINAMKDTLDPTSVLFDQAMDTAGRSRFRSGAMNTVGAQPVTGFLGFPAPPPWGMSIEMSGEIGATTRPWQLIVSSNIANATKRFIGTSRKEVQTVVVTLVAEY